MNAEEAWMYFKDVIEKGIEECIPKVRNRTGKRAKPVWMDNKAMRLLKKKYNCYKRFMQTKSGKDYSNYIKVRNESTKLIKKLRKSHEKTVAKEGKKNPKKFWKYMKEQLHMNTGVNSLKRPDGSLASNDKEKAETLNDFFTSVFTKERTDNLPDLGPASKSNGVTLCDIRLTPSAVKCKLNQLNENKAQGPDKISPKVLKELSEELSTPLCAIFNKSLESGIIPTDWKKAEVTAIFKKGSKSEPGNYRPVSLTCIVCKVLESFIRDEIVDFFTKNNLYAKCQHGFRKKRSCVTQLLEVMEELTTYMDNKTPIDIIYLDFKKAFDTVPHKRLLVKLKAYGIQGKVLSWIQGFLSDRKQRVKVGESISPETQVLSGIPQGSILGPVLFTVFINDLPEVIKSTCKIFADDTKVYNKADNKDILQTDLEALNKWSDKWNLYFNVSKCKVMHVGKSNPLNEYTMKMGDNIEFINKCEEEKDLGVTFDKDLNFNAHIQRIVNTANQVSGMIKRAFTFIDKDVFLQLFKTFVRPHLEYGNAIWHPTWKYQSKAVENVQRRATKALKECQEMSYKERLKFLNLYSLKGRRLRGDLIQAFKIINDIDDTDVSSFFTFRQDCKTRNSDSKIFVEHANTNRRKYCFSNRVTNIWNSLPPTSKFTKSTNSFKNLLDSDAKLVEMFYEYDE
jgi:hypothetical protein